MDAYRAELGGFYGCIMSINYICQKFNISEGSIKMGYDCESAYNNIVNHYPFPITKNHWDLITETQHALFASPITWKFHKIQAHQDNVLLYNDLNDWEKANVNMD